MQIVAAVVFGMVVLGAVPDPWTVVGMAVVTLAGVYVLRRQAAFDPREGNQASEQYHQLLAEPEGQLPDAGLPPEVRQ